jgi:hypothetical protein
MVTIVTVLCEEHAYAKEKVEYYLGLHNNAENLANWRKC